MILTWLISKSKSLLSSYLFVSYSSIYFIRFSMNIFVEFLRLVGSSGLEPPTSRLSGARSNHLSYEPISSRTCHLFVSLNSPFGGDDGIRTHDPLLAGQVLSQLSYTPVLFRVSGLFAFEQSLKIEQQEDTETSSLSWVFLSVKPFSYGLPFLVTVYVNPSGIDGSP